MKGKVLFIIKVPPPITGATLMNQRIANSRRIRSSFASDYILINYNEGRSEFGKISFNKFFTVLHVIKNISLKLNQNKFDLLYFQITPTGVGFLRDSGYMLIAKLFKVPIVYHIRGKGIKESSKGYFKKLLYKLIFKNETIICHSDIVAEDFQEIFEGKYYVVENGIPVVIDDKQIEVRYRKEKIPTLLYLSTLRKSKGIYDFIDALAVLMDENIDFKAVIIGEPTSELSVDSLKEQLSRRGIQDRVDVLGPVYDDEKFGYLLHADIFIFPTLFEAFGNVVLEAFQAGLPVIASDEGSLPVMIEDGEDGFLYKKGKTDELVDKMKILIEDGDLRKKMGTKGREKFLQKYTLESFEKRLIDSLQEIINSKTEKGITP